MIYKIYVDLYHIMIHMMSKMCISKTISGINAFLLFFIIVKKKFKKLNEVNMINFCENNKHIDLLGILLYKRGLNFTNLE